MNDTPKPPMVVWLTGKQLPCEAVRRRYSTWAEHGPFVHLDQFLEEVERRAIEQHATTLSQYGFDFHEAVQELAKKLKEQNEN